MFGDSVLNCGLVDLGFVGELFTWMNQREGDANTLERIDRDLTTYEWLALFHNAVLRHELRIGSEHNPIFLELNKDRRKTRIHFRYDSKREEIPGFRGRYRCFCPGIFQPGLQKCLKGSDR